MSTSVRFANVVLSVAQLCSSELFFFNFFRITSENAFERFASWHSHHLHAWGSFSAISNMVTSLKNVSSCRSSLLLTAFSSSASLCEETWWTRESGAFKNSREVRGCLLPLASMTVGFVPVFWMKLWPQGLLWQSVTSSVGLFSMIHSVVPVAQISPVLNYTSFGNDHLIFNATTQEQQAGEVPLKCFHRCLGTPWRFLCLWCKIAPRSLRRPMHRNMTSDVTNPAGTTCLFLGFAAQEGASLRVGLCWHDDRDKSHLQG